MPAWKSSMQLRRRVYRIIATWQTLLGSISHPYRPELHYMRGPGPKWHARHQAAQRS